MQWNKAQGWMPVGLIVLRWRLLIFSLLFECLIYTLRTRLNLLFPAETANRRFSFSARAKYPSRYATGSARNMAWYKTHQWNRKGDVSSAFKNCKPFQLLMWYVTWVGRDTEMVGAKITPKWSIRFNRKASCVISAKTTQRATKLSCYLSR